MYGLKKLALVRTYFAGLHLSRQFCVFVDEPRFTQHVRCRVLQLDSIVNTPTHRQSLQSFIIKVKVKVRQFV